MSDLNDLIHTNAHNAYAIGVKTEQERIVKLLTEIELTRYIDKKLSIDLEALIRGVQK